MSPLDRSCARRMVWLSSVAVLAAAAAVAQEKPPSAEDFTAYAARLRSETLGKLAQPTLIPTSAHPLPTRARFPWKNNIVASVFAVSKKNAASAWDPEWLRHYGGRDPLKPEARKDYRPAAFVPELNPFYIALPYNDLQGKERRPEAREVIPWFAEADDGSGRSVCRDRWVRMRNRDGRECYAQWADCGPHGRDHWQYVFGDDRPRANVHAGVGISVSPAVRDYLSLANPDVIDWSFVDEADVPRGPWTLYGKNHSRKVATDAAPRVAEPQPGPMILLLR